MSRLDHGRPSMSRRKPVPKFIPSPPPSPPSSPGAPFGQISLSSVSPTQTDMPPLPDDWRDVIDRMVSKEWYSALPTINTVVDREVLPNDNDNDGEVEGERQSPASTEFGTTRSFAFAPPSPCDSFDGEPVSRPDSPTPWARPGGRRRPQTEYRPPTPPLPRERSRSAESGSESLTVVNPNSVRSLPQIPPPNERRASVLPPLPAPKPVRPFPDVRKVPLPTPPPSWSIHDHSVHPSGRSFSPEKVSPTLCSASTATHTPSPSTPHSEKNMSQTSRSMRAMSAKDEQRHRKPSADPVQMPGLAKIERKRLPARPGVLRLTLTRGLSGLKRVSALVASVLSCRP